MSDQITPYLRTIDSDGNVVESVPPQGNTDAFGVDEAVPPDVASDFVVTKFSGTLPVDSDSTQLQDGTTVTDPRGDLNIRFNMEMEMTAGLLAKLQGMLDSPNLLEVVCSLGSFEATFDQLKFDRIPDSNGKVTINRDVSANSPEVSEGEIITNSSEMFAVQLQSKEKSEDDNALIFNSNDN